MSGETTFFEFFWNSLLKEFTGIDPLTQEIVIVYKVVKFPLHPGYYP